MGLADNIEESLSIIKQKVNKQETQKSNIQIIGKKVEERKIIIKTYLRKFSDGQESTDWKNPSQSQHGG